MSDQSKLGLGKPITTNQFRDAIHIAVAPVIAAHTLIAGRHVGIDEHGHASEHTGEQIGVVDPFLKITIEKGGTFWLFLYPGTITSLRHEWAHPAFATHQEPLDDDKEIARKWLVLFGDEWNIPYSELIEGAESGDGITAHGMDIHGWNEISTTVQFDFWRNLEIVTGKRFDSAHREGTYFSCSC